jgi:signal transduction histidine kinase
MTAADVQPASIDTTARVRAEQVRLLYVNGGAPMVATLAAGLTLAFVMVSAGALEVRVAGLWSAAMAAHTGARLLVRRGYFRASDAAIQWRLWARRFMVGALAGGLAWGVGAWLMLTPGRLDLQMLVVAVMTAVIYGTVTAWGSYLPAFFAMFAPAFTPVVLWFALQSDALHRIFAGLVLLWVPMVVLLARRYNASLVTALELSFANAALAEDLRLQKQAAEQTSLAKSRFLASASHDLRQPVHALGMFIGALRSHRLSRRSAELVDQMDASIGALDGLFGSLLDISRLDAGAVEGRPGTVALQPLFTRLCAELEAEAQAKGVELVAAPTAAAVTSDPVLLERVLRNLIANAVRYTEQGWVMVGAAPRGDRVCIEVRDTGPGIAPHLREAVFEEFFQIGNPDRDRRKGLGLGLPIVRRLTAILRHELEMESVPGEGTVFRVIAPLANAPPAPIAVAELPERAVGPGVILAIDDEQAIRSAIRELLKSWGHQAATAAGAEEALEAVAAGLRPDLIVCDQRLRDGETGVAAIARLRAALRTEVPAILVTGDTAPEAIRQALASGHPLLHKPLAHGKLRAAVNNLLRRGPPAPLTTEA